MVKNRKLPNNLFLKQVKNQALNKDKNEIKPKTIIRKKSKPLNLSDNKKINQKDINSDIFKDDDLKLSSGSSNNYNNGGNFVPPNTSMRKNNSNIFIGFVISLVFFIWMISGFISDNNDVIVKSPNSKPSNTKFNINNALYENIDVVKSSAFYHTQSIKTNGVLNASMKGEITTPIPGKIVFITNKSGKYVRRGEIIAKIEDHDYRAEYNNMKSLLSTASVVHKTNIELFDKNLISELELNNSLNDYLAAKSSYIRAKKNLIDTVIYAPYSGKLSEILIQRNQYLRANQSIVNIVSNSDFYLDIDVAEEQLKHIKIGKKIVGKSVSGRKIKGRVKYINNTVNKNTNTYMIRTVVNGKNFIDGSLADVQILLGKVLAHKVPASLITLSSNGKESIKVLGNKNIVKYKKVTILSSDQNSIIVSGLSRNERIINKGYGFVKQGQKISTFNIAKEYNQ